MTGTAPVATAGRLKRYALLAAGSVCVVLGAIGVVLPLLPTTPFLLVAAACFIRTSPRFYHWLINNRVLGAYIRDYLSGAGMPRRAKVITIGLLWLAIGSSAIFFVETTAIRILLLIIAIGVTAHVISIRPSKR